MTQLIWTRARQDWAKDFDRFGHIQNHTRHLPCISLQSLPVKFPDGEFPYFVYTSANAVRFAEKSPRIMLAMQKAKGIFTFGRATSALLSTLGFDVTRPPGVHSAKQLGEYIAGNLQKGERIAIPSPEAPAFDMTTALSKAGLQPEQIVLYQTLAKMTYPDGTVVDRKEAERLESELTGVVCFASPSAVEGFCNILSPKENRLHESLKAVSIGPVTHKAASPNFKESYVCNTANLTSLIARATELLGNVET